MAAQFDAIIIGGGHNGLVCGAYLAKAGLKALVLERRHIVGGAAVTEEFSPGFRASTFSYIMGHMHPKVIADLELKSFGLEFLKMNEVIYPLPDSDYIVFTNDPKKNQEQIARFSKKDAENYPAFFEHMSEAIRVVRSLLLETPIDPPSRDWRALKKNAGFLWRYHKIGDQFYRLYDALTMSAYDYLSQWFESDVVKAVFAYWASIGSKLGPRAPGTAFSPGVAMMVSGLLGAPGSIPSQVWKIEPASSREFTGSEIEMLALPAASVTVGTVSSIDV